MIKILIVDDSPTARDIIASLVAIDENIKIVGYAENGSQAVEYNRMLEPDVILMDIHMPIMDGITATRRIMKTRPVPIVIMTTDYTSNQLSEAMTAGAVDVYEKPNMAWGIEQIRDFCAKLNVLATQPLPRHE
jgi:two-component system chemotaxis response regulator CheB